MHIPPWVVESDLVLRLKITTETVEKAILMWGDFFLKQAFGLK
jgi:hypothetical protein